MDGFALLLGHLVGDYIVQNDWMASNKTNPHPGQMSSMIKLRSSDPSVDQVRWIDGLHAYTTGNIACLVHCVLYTLAIACFSYWWITPVGLILCGCIHYPVDRYRLANKWMVLVSGQEKFATGPLAPWSIILVDNIFHLLTLYVIWILTTKGIL